MKSKKRLLSELLSGSGVLSALKDRLGDRLVGINFHRIATRHGAGSAFSDDTSDDAAGFEAQIVWLKHNLRLLSEDELIDAIQSGRHPKGLSGVVTFDDGYIDNYTLAYPILKYHRVPAIFFIPTGLIDSRRLGWWDQIAHALKSSERASFALDGQEYESKAPFTFIALCRKMKKEMHQPGHDLVGELRRALQVPAPDATLQSRELMSWDQIREISPFIAIGSHTETHPIMANQPLERQRAELVRSKAGLEQQLGKTVRSIAYPVGGRHHFSADTKRIAQEVGYAAGFSYYSGINSWGAFDAFDIRRTSAIGSDQVSMASATILPELLSYEMGENA